MEDKLSDALVQLWRGDRPELSERGAATAQELRQRYQIELPGEFEAYLLRGAPLIDWIDDGGIIWWPPERIKSLSDECPRPGPASQYNPEIDAEQNQYVVFADFLDWCYAYAICCSPGPNRGKVALIGVNPDRFIAASMSSFVRLAAEDSPRLHSPVGDHFTDLQ